jgi:DNA-binding transcriptional regulator GbsR (MarR family)
VVQNDNEINKAYYQPLFVITKDICKLFLTTFDKSNTISVKKPKSLIQSVLNITKNDVTKRSKGKNQTETDKLLNQEMQRKPMYNNVVAYNVCRFMHYVKVFTFVSDKDITYNLENIKKYSHLSLDQEFKISLADFCVEKAD